MKEKGNGFCSLYPQEKSETGAHEYKTTIHGKSTLKTAELCPRNWLELSGELWLGELGLVSPGQRGFSVFTPWGTSEVWEEAWN